MSLLDQNRLAMLRSLVRKSLALPEGEIWECGVYKGGSSQAIAQEMAYRGDAVRFRLFDTFSGHPQDDSSGDHRKGGYADTSVENIVHAMEPWPFHAIHVGEIPSTFAGLQSAKIRFAHIDVDLYQSTKAAFEFIWPRMVARGIVLDDDYYATECGARKAVDEFMATLPRDSYEQYNGYFPQAYFVKKWY